jgi:hypothetical protein
VKRGGRVVIEDAAVDTAPARFLNGFVAANNPMGHDGRFLDQHTTGLLEQAGFAILSAGPVPTPWAFEDFDAAGEFGRHLFGITSLTAASVAEAMAELIGFDMVAGAPRLRWELQRIVCEAV